MHSKSISVLCVSGSNPFLLSHVGWNQFERASMPSGWVVIFFLLPAAPFFCRKLLIRDFGGFLFFKGNVHASLDAALAMRRQPSLPRLPSMTHSPVVAPSVALLVRLLGPQMSPKSTWHAVPALKFSDDIGEPRFDSCCCLALPQNLHWNSVASGGGGMPSTRCWVHKRVQGARSCPLMPKFQFVKGFAHVATECTHTLKGHVSGVCGVSGWAGGLRGVVARQRWWRLCRLVTVEL